MRELEKMQLKIKKEYEEEKYIFCLLSMAKMILLREHEVKQQLIFDKIIAYFNPFSVGFILGSLLSFIILGVK